jgi:hypothetical protein
VVGKVVALGHTEKAISEEGKVSAKRSRRSFESTVNTLVKKKKKKKCKAAE